MALLLHEYVTDKVDCEEIMLVMCSVMDKDIPNFVMCLVQIDQNVDVGVLFRGDARPSRDEAVEEFRMMMEQLLWKIVAGRLDTEIKAC
jgi:hypothetical protein